jgi:DNA polymerase III delta prime subunit
MFDNLWIEKYRPKVLADVILTSENAAIVGKFQKEEEIPNLLLVGSPGVGKTTLAKVLVHDVLKSQYLYINASDENGIDTIRNKVVQFARTMSLDGGIKVIILDECDGLSQDAQRALRNTMEEYSEITRFILTANYGHRIIPALQSRCQSLDLTPPLEECITRIQHILDQQEVSISKDQTDELAKFIKNNYPDLRKIINEVQKCCSANGEIVISSSVKGEEFAKQILTLTTNGHVLRVRKYIIENEEKFNSDYPVLLKMIFNEIDTSSNKHKEMQLVAVAEALYRSAFVVDQEINAYSCLIQLSDITKN